MDRDHLSSSTSCLFIITGGGGDGSKFIAHPFHSEFTPNFLISFSCS